MILLLQHQQLLAVFVLLIILRKRWQAVNLFLNLCSWVMRERTSSTFLSIHYFIHHWKEVLKLIKIKLYIITRYQWCRGLSLLLHSTVIFLLLLLSNLFLNNYLFCQKHLVTAVLLHCFIHFSMKSFTNWIFVHRQSLLLAFLCLVSSFLHQYQKKKIWSCQIHSLGLFL